jgi:two-component system, NtrC family, response regulator AtoC
MSHESGLISEEVKATSVRQLSAPTICAEESAYPSDFSFADDPLRQVEILNDGSFFVSSSPAMLRIRELVEKIANFDFPVLILGESGTGKEVVARLIHSRSSRARRSFLKVNCAALPETLLESELFGYECGAFTGAARSKMGKFEFCNSGTILLDEIGEMPPTIQAKLLHVLQDQAFSRLGGHTTIRVDVRIIAATNVNIFEALKSGELREDLYYRLNTFVISVPPLRSRQGEIPLLLEHFIRRFAADYGCPAIPVSGNLVEACINYPWPGNIRELQSFVHRLLIQRDERQALQELQVHAPRMTTPGTGPQGIARVSSSDLKALGREIKANTERKAIARMLLETRNNRKVAAQRLEISYKALLYKINQYGLDGNAPPAGEDQRRLEGNHS